MPELLFMKFYSESQMKMIREEFEEEILRCPHVATKKMFGCPSYTVKEKLFAFLVANGVVLTRLSDNDRIDALNVSGAQVFEHNQRVIKKWVRLPVKDHTALNAVMGLVMKSYQNALALEK